MNTKTQDPSIASTLIGGGLLVLAIILFWGLMDDTDADEPSKYKTSQDMIKECKSNYISEGVDIIIIGSATYRAVDDGHLVHVRTKSHQGKFCLFDDDKNLIETT